MLGSLAFGLHEKIGGLQHQILERDWTAESQIQAGGSFSLVLIYAILLTLSHTIVRYYSQLIIKVHLLIVLTTSGLRPPSCLRNHANLKCIGYGRLVQLQFLIDYDLSTKVSRCSFVEGKKIDYC
ncbi:hypothetical protein V6N11_022744 [Hibiscus sabdariffa]|uniref:Uncharacterized protein n=1 Tax=Hibiscus sabdariffa TaxID=183260 RepID=A0ABR2TK58_9ROSI